MLNYLSVSPVTHHPIKLALRLTQLAHWVPRLDPHPQGQSAVAGATVISEWKIDVDVENPLLFVDECS